MKFSALEYDTKDMLVRQMATVRQETEGFRRHAFRGEWEMAREAARAIIGAAELLRDEAAAQWEVQDNETKTVV